MSFCDFVPEDPSCQTPTDGDNTTSGHPKVDPVGVSMIQLLKTVSMFCHKLARNKKTKPEMKSYMVVKDIRCVLKLDLWPSQG